MYTLMKPAGGNMGGVSVHSWRKNQFFQRFNQTSSNQFTWHLLSCFLFVSFRSIYAMLPIKQMNEFKQEFPMGSGGDNPMGNPMNPSMGNVLNGNDLDGMKNSPANGGPGTPREDSGSGMGDYSLGSFGGPGENVSFLWIKKKTEKKQQTHTHIRKTYPSTNQLQL